MAERIVASDRYDDVARVWRYSADLTVRHVSGDVPIHGYQAHLPFVAQTGAQLVTDIWRRSDIDVIIEDRIAEKCDMFHVWPRVADRLATAGISPALSMSVLQDAKGLGRKLPELGPDFRILA